MWTESPLLRDVGAALLTAVVAAAVLRFWEVVANRQLLDQKLCRKLVHITVGFAYFLMWPLFSSNDVYAPFLAPLIIELNIVKVTLIGLGIVKDEGVVNSMTRHGDRRELLKGPLYYACAATLTTIIFWRTSPISIVVLCNLFAGDVVESLPISTRLDDNLTVPLASALVGALVFHFIGVRNLCCMSSDGSNISTIVQMVFAGSSK
ncbi:hypothetical protein EJB05_30077 [Eragrostis curvula]|uniref:Dolichol kinase n=1 Tax=Eragrostis curvula TaxID=38414 RepID=A0A5J9UV42_9POAL|nr:hypothetical protein EJB05_30077 [Eragrostis curvula]